MKMMPWIAAAAILCVLAPRAGHALTEGNFTAQTTGDLVELCSPPADSPYATAAINFCHGFAQGAVTVEMAHDAVSRIPKMFCLPTPAPERTATLNEFVKWARATPDHLNDPAADGLFRFLGERFPCAKTR